MPSKHVIQRFEDIFTNICRIEEHTAGMNFDASMEDRKTYDAVERRLERISEAAKKLGDAAEGLCPEIPWPQIRGLGNVLRPEYDRIESFRICYMIEDDLPRLKAAADAALKSLRNPDHQS